MMLKLVGSFFTVIAVGLGMLVLVFGISILNNKASDGSRKKVKQELIPIIASVLIGFLTVMLMGVILYLAQQP